MTEEAERTLAAEPGLAGTVAASTSATSEAAELPRGTAVARYVILARLGAGAMGVVYAAYDPELDRKVALKLVRARADAGPEATVGRTRLLREAQALARLSHPNVVAIHDVGTFGEQVWLAMEHVDGRTLKEWMRTRRGWREVLPVMLAVAEGLAAAHAAGLVHRDLKPDNVMIGGDGRVRVMDFGLARTAGQVVARETPVPVVASNTALSMSVTLAGSLMGTPAYMAPEQMQGQEADARADQFAFCVALWEALVGERPFAGETLLDLMVAMMEGRLRPLPRAARVPGWLRRVLYKGLQAGPERRFASMPALLAELARGQQRARTGRGLAVAAALGVLAVATGLWQRHVHTQQLAGCAAAGAEIEALWDAAGRERLRAGLLATGAEAATTTFEKVAPWVDRRIAGWREQRAAVCREGTIEGTLPADLYVRAVGCLDERRDELAGLLGLLGEGDAAAVQRAVPAVAGLAPLTNCRDRAALERRAAPADDPAIHARAVALRQALTRANGLGLTGRNTEGLARAEAALAEAEEVGEVGLIVEARLSVGGLALRTGKLELAEAQLGRAYVDGGAAGLDEAAAAAAVYLIEVVGVQGSRIAEGLQWARSAELFVRRLGQMEGLRGAGLRNNLANLHAVRGATEEALAVGQAALEIRVRELGEDHPIVGASLVNLAETNREAGRLDRAEVLQARALGILERTLGPEHPHVATALNNLGGVYVQRGEPGRGEEALARALAIRERVLGPDHPEVATTLQNLSEVARKRGRLEEARGLLTRALGIRERAFGPEHPEVGRGLVALAELALERGEVGEAEALAERALGLAERAYGQEHPDVARVVELLGRVRARRGG